MATTEELIAAAKTKLATIIAGSAAANVDYTIGDKSVSKSQYMEFLRKLISELSTQEANTMVALDIVQFDSGIQLSGEDTTQFTVL